MPESATEIAALVPLLWEIANLKRVRPAQLSTSFATDLFLRAWSEIADGANVRQTAIITTTKAVAAAQLGAIDAGVLRQAELSDTQINEILTRSFDLSATRIAPELREELRASLNFQIANLQSEIATPPLFAGQLCNQPRSGATKPNAPRLVFDAPENHADHCVSVAIFGVLLAPLFAANIETVFLTGLAHHFHNATLPDSGFAGEELLGEFLPVIFHNLREQCLRELPASLHENLRRIFAEIERADTPEAKTFHASDVIDRVLQMRHHAQSNEFTLKFALEEMELVHAGAVQNFHYEILRAANLV